MAQEIGMGRSHLSGPTWVAIVLVVIGALNWGLVGVFAVDLVAAAFGTLSPLSRIIYVLVALAGIYLLALAFGRLRQVPRPPRVVTSTP